MAEFIEGVGKEFRIKGDRRSLKYGEERGEFRIWGTGVQEMGEGAQEFNRGEMKQKFKKEGGGLHEFKRWVQNLLEMEGFSRNFSKKKHKK